MQLQKAASLARSNLLQGSLKLALLGLNLKVSEVGAVRWSRELRAVLTTEREKKKKKRDASTEIDEVSRTGVARKRDVPS